MKQEDFEALKATVQAAARSGDASAFAQTSVARQIGALVAAYEAQQRAEGFWGERAPALNDELLAIRPLERFARLIANGGELSGEQGKELGEALANLDAVRAAQAKKNESGAAA